MAFWWVNHKQTFAEEIGGNYVWAPETTKSGAVKRTYLSLREVEPGDVVVSYADSAIRAVGIATERFHEANRPFAEEHGDSWNKLGWRVPIKWTLLDRPLRPREHIDVIRPLLPSQLSPLLKSGRGAENSYLAAISDELFALIDRLIRREEPSVLDEIEADREELRIWRSNKTDAQKTILCMARLGHGKYKDEMLKIETACRLTGTTIKEALIASHAKPWAKSTNKEKIDPNNGLPLAPHADWFFDRFLMSFADNGQVITAGAKVDDLMKSWGLDPKKKTKKLRVRQQPYMKWHRGELSKIKASEKWA